MTTTDQSDLSPAPGIIPEPVHVHEGSAPLTAASEKPGARSPGGRNPFRIAFARVMSALHGDKYTIDAYAAAGSKDAAPTDDAG